MLELTVDQAIRFFPREEKLGQALWQLQQVGLGYLRLGQPATTLSGGEAQRIKIARELARRRRRKRAGSSTSWTSRRPGCISRTSASSPKCSTGLIERGAHAGAHRAQPRRHQARRLGDRPRSRGRIGGGKLVAMGRPEEVAAVKESHTGQWLAPILKKSRVPVVTDNRQRAAR